MIKAIVAVDNNWSIGKNNDLLFKLPYDMKFFKQNTQNKVVICGRKTLESFPGKKPLPKRSTICLCSEKNNRNDCYCVNSLKDLTNIMLELSKTQDIFVIGGAMLYETLLPYFDEVLVTKVKADGNGTMFFPNLDGTDAFELSYCSEDIQDNGYTINFCTYKRKLIND